MKKRIIVLLLGSLIFTFILIGCTTKTEETKTAVPPASQANQQQEFENVPNAGDAWEAVKIQVVETGSDKTTDYTVKIGGDYTVIANTNMKLKVEQFIPDFFMMGPGRFGSRSKELNNPAAMIIVTQEGKPEPFKGWIFSRYPDIHKGPSEKHSFRLVDFVKK